MYAPLIELSDPHIAGDAFALELLMTEGEDEKPIDLSDYTEFTAQWRVHPTYKKSYTLTVDSSQSMQGILEVREDDGAKTRDWYGPGYIDVQALPGPVTLVRVKFRTEMDVTK